MTWSAPIDRTRSTLVVLHTPVTSVPNVLAICTARVPMPPPAPLIRTFARAARGLDRGGPAGRLPGHGDAGGLLEGDSGRFAHQVGSRRDRVFGEGARSRPEDIVPDPQILHV